MISRLLNLARDQAGMAMVEFAIVLPVLAAVLLGITQFGIIFYDYAIVENAAAVGERQFLMGRPLNCPSTTGTPYSTAVSAIQTATGGLQSSQVTMALSVAGTACTTNASCSTALCNAYFATGAFSTAQTASVTVSYPCLNLLPVSWAPNNFCPLKLTVTQRVD